jgi:hypothetical protein
MQADRSKTCGTFQMSPELPTAKRKDRNAFVSFAMALFLLVLPVMADIATGLMFLRQYWAVAIWMACCYGLVTTLWGLSLKRHWKEPGVWSGSGYLIATGIILALHAVMLTAAAMQWLMTGDL